MNRRIRKQRLISEINITPFTDVILVLLIIFMVVTPLIFQATIKIHLPEAQASSEEPPKTFTITINKQGEAFFEDDKYNLRFDLDILKYKLASLIKKQSNTSLIINGDSSVQYDFIVKVMDLAGQLNIRHILLGVQPRK